MVTSPTTVNVVFVLVPPAIENPFASAVGLMPLIVLFVSVSVPLKVAIVPLVGSVTFVLPVVVIVVVKLPDVIKLPAVVNAPPKTTGLPPKLFTVAVAVTSDVPLNVGLV